MDMNKIRNSMTNQKPNENQIIRIEQLRNMFIAVAEVINSKTEDCREKSLAITKLEESLMWAVKAIVLEDK